jgi:hypothetical protein
MTKQTYEPGPGRSTSDAAFGELTKEVARQNEVAHKAAQKLRVERDRQKMILRSQQDLD